MASANKQKALEIFLEHKGEISNRKIADMLSEKEKTISAWKSRDKWTVVLLQNSDCSTTEKNSQKSVVLQNSAAKNDLHKKKNGPPFGSKNAKGHGAPKGNQNALGNRGGHGPPPGTQNNLKHGFFAKILPDDDETRDIFDEISIKSPIDILWENIVLQYGIIARAQKIMYVRNQEDLTKELKKRKVENGFSRDKEGNIDKQEIFCEEEYELQFAWDKHATLLKAQSMAMKTLEGMLKRYDELCKSDLATEEQLARIDKIKAETLKLQGDGGGGEEPVQFVDDIGGDDDADG